MRKWATVLFFLFSAGNLLGQDTLSGYYSRQIKKEHLSAYLHRLASDEFEGRETGKRGQHLTSNFIAAHFDSIGIPPSKNGSYFQEYPLEVMYPEGVTINAGQKSFAFLKDFYYLPVFQDTVINNDNIVFLGYGIDDSTYSDYTSLINLKGKIVMFLSGEPLDKNRKSLITKSEKLSSWSTDWKKKINYLKTFHPAAILVVINSVKNSVLKSKHTIEAPALKSSDKAKENIPYFYISHRMGEKILGKRKGEIKQLGKNILKSPGKVFSFETTCDLELNITRAANKMHASNVLGFIEGGDLKEEIIVISAHMDHLGKSGNVIYYGADDDGSGTSAVMDMSNAFSLAKKAGHGPRRSVLFISFSGEEKGLLGSKYYSENPIYPLKNTVANLNIDMIGRVDDKHMDKPDYLYLIGSDKLSTQLYKMNETVNAEKYHFELDYTFNKPNDPNRFYYRSDHYNFAKNNIPVIFYFNGTHEDYHKPTDTVDKINFNLLEKRTRFIFETAWKIANE